MNEFLNNLRQAGASKRLLLQVERDLVMGTTQLQGRDLYSRGQGMGQRPILRLDTATNTFSADPEYFTGLLD